MPLLNTGDAAPTFTTQDQDGNSIKLQDYAGKWVVLYFYPRAMTPGCTTQACSLRDVKAELEELSAVPLGVSPDKPDSLKKFEQKEGLNFTLLSDEDHEIAEAYGAWQEKSMYGKKFMGIARMTYIINPAGEVAAVIKRAKPKTHHDDVIKLLKELKN